MKHTNPIILEYKLELRKLKKNNDETLIKHCLQEIWELIYQLEKIVSKNKSNIDK